MSTIDTVTAEHDRPVAVVVEVKITALAYPEPGGGYSVVVPALPGCFTEADTLEDIAAQVREAADGWIGSMHDRNAH